MLCTCEYKHRLIQKDDLVSLLQITFDLDANKYYIIDKCMQFPINAILGMLQYRKEIILSFYGVSSQ